MSGGEFGTPGDGRGVELAREYLATHSPAASHVNRLLEMDRDAVMEAAAERVCGPVGCPPGSVFDGKEDSLADAVHQAVATALEKLGQLGYPVTFGPAPGSETADLPATLASVDDVRRVCEAAGLKKRDDARGHSTIDWSVPGLRIACTQATWPSTALVDSVAVWTPTALVAVVYGQAPSSLLWHAIQAARSTS